MKIAIFSDIHGNLQALESIVTDIKKNNYDEVICLGDVIAMGPNPKECLDLIICNNYKMLLGNHELYYLKGTQIDDEMGEGEIQHQKWIKNQLNETHRNFLDKCPMKIKTDINGKKVLFQHFLINYNSKDDYPFDELNIIKDGTIAEKISDIEIDYMFIGHEHKSFEINLENKKLVDVGSSGCTKVETTFYTVLTIENGNVNIEKKYISYNRNKFINTIQSKKYPEKEIISKIFFGIRCEE